MYTLLLYCENKEYKIIEHLLKCFLLTGTQFFNAVDKHLKCISLTIFELSN